VRLVLVLVLAAALIGVTVAAAVRARRAGRDDAPEGRTWWLRRLLQYGFLLVALFSAASGLNRVLGAAVPAGRRIAGPGSSDLALGLSLALVAVPIWLLLWRVVGRRLRDDVEERSSTAWSLTIATAATVALIIADVNLVRVASWALGAADFDGWALSGAVVWGGVWVLHAWFARRPDVAPAGPLSDLSGLAGSAVGVVGLALGAHGVVLWGSQQVYLAIAGPALIEGATTTALRRSLAITVVAVAIWWWHWLRWSARATVTPFWHGYVLLVGVLGGLLTAVGGAAVVVHALLQWWIGDPEATRAAVHFAGLPRALAAVVVGGWVWRYHRAVLDERGRRRSEPQRAYEHLVAAVGLVATASGASAALVAAIVALAPAPLVSDDPTGRNTLVTAVTLLIVGAPLWWRFWRRLQAGVVAGEPDELASPSRRAYLFVVFGIAALTAAISGVVLLFVLLRDLLEGTLAVTVLHELRVAVALVIIAGGLSAYHWMVLRDDRRALPHRDERPDRHVLLVSADGDQLADGVAARTGAKVQVLRRVDVAASAVDPDAVSEAILASPHPRLLVTVEGDGTIHAIPYETVRGHPRA
jgi:hypothetical protein